MSVEQWQPLSSRLGNTSAAQVWREDVPAALESNLRQWVSQATMPRSFSSSNKGKSLVERVVLRLNLVADTKRDTLAQPLTIGDLRMVAARVPAELLFDVVDAMLELLDMDPEPSWLKKQGAYRISQEKQYRASIRESLAFQLDNALSVYRVRDDGRGLERRAEAMATAALEEAADTAADKPAAGSAAAHLRRAWDSLHSLHPDPGIAHSEAVKAVEAAAHSVLEPGNSKATLGTMLRILRDHPDRFSLAIPGPDGAGRIAPLVVNMRLLWEGQTSRHGSQSPTRQETLQEAAMAVSIAVLLVGWFTSGAVRNNASN